MTSILEAKKEIENILLGIDEVQGLGISEDRQSIIIYVSKVTSELLQAIPGSIAGYYVIVKEVGIFKPTPDFAASAVEPQRLWRYRPVVGGISSGHYAITAGTLGCIVQDSNTDKPLLLSNNHVYAAISTDQTQRAQVSDPVLQPGAIDGGKIEDTVGTLNRWIPIKVGSANAVDAAVANSTYQPSPYILGENDEYIEIKGLKTVTQGIAVKKAGRTTGLTRGQIIDTDYTGMVDYNGQVLTFTDQLLVSIMIQGGDSGSILLDENDNAVGLLFAGAQDNYGNYYGVANKINTVFSLLQIELPSGEEPEEPEEPTESNGLLITLGLIAPIALLALGSVKMGGK